MKTQQKVYSPIKKSPFLPCNVFVKCAGQCLHGHSANDSVPLLSLQEHHNSGDATNAIFSSNVGAFICVQFQAPDLATILLCNLVNNWGDHATRSTPRSPEVHQHRYLTFRYQALPCRFAYNSSHCKKTHTYSKSLVFGTVTLLQCLHA
jgi:hypothetical protein